MKILAVNYEYTLTGSSLALLRLTAHWRRQGHEVSVCAAVAAPGPVKDEYLRQGFPVLELPLTGAFDAYICNTLFTAPIVLQCARGGKTIWWIHEGSIGVDALLRNPTHPAAFAAAAAVVFPVAFLRDAIYRSFIYGLDQGRFHIIPSGIPVIDLPPHQPQANAALRVVSIGSLYPRKRHEDLIRAVALIGQSPIQCTLVGPFQFLPEDCMRLIAANPAKLDLAGEVDHRTALTILNGADIFCLPSASEVAPLAILEAAMLGKPLVLSDLAVYEGLWRHGHNCLLHPVGDAELLSQSIAMLAAKPDLRHRLGQAAKKTAAPYTEKAQLARFDTLLGSL